MYISEYDLSQQIRALLQAQDGDNFFCEDLAQKNQNIGDKPTSYILRCNGTFVDHLFTEVNKKQVQVDGGDIANLLKSFCGNTQKEHALQLGIVQKMLGNSGYVCTKAKFIAFVYIMNLPGVTMFVTSACFNIVVNYAAYMVLDAWNNINNVNSSNVKQHHVPPTSTKCNGRCKLGGLVQH